MREAVLQKVPSWAVDESVGRFERREKKSRGGSVPGRRPLG